MNAENAIRGPENRTGTNRETANHGGFQVLTETAAGSQIGRNLPKRPDGGVVTQRTANPSSAAQNRDSLQYSRSVPRIAFQGLMRASANHARDTRRMVETRSGSMRSASSPVRKADEPSLSNLGSNPSPGDTND